MKRLSPRPAQVALALLFISTVSLQPCYGEPTVYPADVRVIEPYVRSSLAFPLARNENHGLGGETALGTSFSILALPKSAGIVDFGYRYFPRSHGRSVQIPFLGIGGTHSFTLGDTLRISPSITFNAAAPVERGEPQLTGELFLGGSAKAHLHSRSFVFLRGGVTLPLHARSFPAIFLGFGISRERPILVPVPRVEPSLLIEPRRFSPDGDGRNDVLRLEIEAAAPEAVAGWSLALFDPQAHLFYEWNGRGSPPEELVWRGRSKEGELVSSASDYSVELKVTDRLGRVSTAQGNILVDILVLREDGKLKIRVPSITFPPDSADFALLSEESIIERNRDVLEQLAETFRRFPEYDVRIEGHANREFYDDPTRAVAEQQEVLIPLSRARAQAVKERLVELGIRAERLTVVGLGGESPVVPFSDDDNRWKNRRVEFILLRPPVGLSASPKSNRE